MDDETFLSIPLWINPIGTITGSNAVMIDFQFHCGLTFTSSSPKKILSDICFQFHCGLTSGSEFRK